MDTSLLHGENKRQTDSPIGDNKANWDTRPQKLDKSVCYFFLHYIYT